MCWFRGWFLVSGRRASAEGARFPRYLMGICKQKFLQFKISHFVTQHIIAHTSGGFERRIQSGWGPCRICGVHSNPLHLTFESDELATRGACLVWPLLASCVRVLFTIHTICHRPSHCRSNHRLGNQCDASTPGTTFTNDAILMRAM